MPLKIPILADIQDLHYDLIFFFFFFFMTQAYKPHMFWMNMIDAMYQSLVCFFIPYFVSVQFKPFCFKHLEENWQLSLG